MGTTHVAIHHRVDRGLAALAATAPSLAQDYPTKPIKIIVPFAAGGPPTSMRASSARD
jgi:hypothetical protein